MLLTKPKKHIVFSILGTFKETKNTSFYEKNDPYIGFRPVLDELPNQKNGRKYRCTAPPKSATDSLEYNNLRYPRRH